MEAYNVEGIKQESEQLCQKHQRIEGEWDWSEPWGSWKLSAIYLRNAGFGAFQWNAAGQEGKFGKW